MENWEKHLNRIWNGGKLFIIGAIVLFITFTFGTFKPNKYIVNNIKLAQEQATIDKLKQFGLHAPLFKFKNTKEFVSNVQNCVNYLNLTTEVNNRIPDKIITELASSEL